MSRTLVGLQLEGFLARSRGATLRRALNEDWLNALFPDIRLLVGCNQGHDLHLEGDAATHTVLVCTALPIFARRYLDREPDFVERLAALIHDWKKTCVPAQCALRRTFSWSRSAGCR